VIAAEFVLIPTRYTECQMPLEKVDAPQDDVEEYGAYGEK
jgi:hypothetical protein